jgi:hypothetical protein
MEPHGMHALEIPNENEKRTLSSSPPPPPS